MKISKIICLIAKDRDWRAIMFYAWVWIRSRDKLLLPRVKVDWNRKLIWNRLKWVSWTSECIWRRPSALQPSGGSSISQRDTCGKTHALICLRTLSSEFKCWLLIEARHASVRRLKQKKVKMKTEYGIDDRQMSPDCLRLSFFPCCHIDVYQSNWVYCYPYFEWIL